MSLTDLVITNEEISESLVEKVLKGRVSLLKEGNKVILTRSSSNLPNKLKVLLFLAGGRAWELLDKVVLSFSPNDMEKATGVSGNSLRPTLSELSNSYLVNNNSGRYQITPKGIYELEDLLENNKKEIDFSQKANKKMTGLFKLTKKSNVPVKTEAIKELIEEGYFSTLRNNADIIEELGRRGVTVKPTSLPAFILPMLRNKTLTRERISRDKRKIWAYKIYESRR